MDLNRKIASLESLVDHLQSELSHLNEMLIECGFSEGISTLKATVQEYLEDAAVEEKASPRAVGTLSFLAKADILPFKKGSPMAKIIFEDSGDEVTLPDGSPLVEPCEEAGVPFACTEGVCGTCVIEVVDGMENLSPFNEAEADFLGEMDKERLACQCKIQGGCVKIKF